MRARLKVRAEAVPRVKIVFKERASLLLRVMGCDCLAISQGYDKKTAYFKEFNFLCTQAFKDIFH